MVQSRFRKPVLRTVKVADIVEFSTELGNRCLLLQRLGFNAYWDTEEELIEVLTESAQHPELLEICLESSRCRRFWEIYRIGGTPFSERDPICLLEHGGRYWAVEGKHRVCLAKRAGVESLEALVYHLEKDTESLLPPEGKPGRYCFRFSFCLGSRGFEDVQGTVAYLWVKSPPGTIPGRFDFRETWLDTSQDTRGALVDLFPGLQYRILVNKGFERRGFFRRRKRFVVESEVVIQPDHPKTKIWLMEVSAVEILSTCLAGPPFFRTAYRFGCWRQHHLRQLEHIFPNLR